jgi:hypothetical protein
MNLLELTATAECLLIASCPLVRITLSNYVQNIKALIDSSSEVNIMPY